MSRKNHNRLAAANSNWGERKLGLDGSCAPTPAGPVRRLAGAELEAFAAARGATVAPPREPVLGPRPDPGVNGTWVRLRYGVPIAWG